MLTVVAPMEQELAGVRRELRYQDDASVNLHVIGVGRERAQASLRHVLSSPNDAPRAGLLLLGFAGGLDPALEAADLLIPTSFYAESGRMLIADQEMWHQARLVAAEALIPVVQGNSLTVDQVVRTADAKRELYRQHQIGAVNMEDYWVAEVAADYGVPLLAIRSVLDPVSQALPAYAQGLAGRPGRAALRVGARPWRLPSLLRLAHLRGVSQASLTRFAMAFINHRLAAEQRQLTSV